MRIMNILTVFCVVFTFQSIFGMQKIVTGIAGNPRYEKDAKKEALQNFASFVKTKKGAQYKTIRKAYINNDVFSSNQEFDNFVEEHAKEAPAKEKMPEDLGVYGTLVNAVAQFTDPQAKSEAAAEVLHFLFGEQVDPSHQVYQEAGISQDQVKNLQEKQPGYQLKQSAQLVDEVLQENLVKA